MRRLACGFVLMGLVAGLAHAQREPKTIVVKSNPTPERYVYFVKNGAAKDLAASLAKHFQADEAISIIAEPNANALLVAAPASSLEQITKTLELLDRQPRRILLDVLVAEVPFDEKEAAANPDDFSGPSDAVFAKAEALARKVKNGQTRRFRITAMENQKATVTIGASQPFVTGVAGVRGGGFGGGGGPAGAVEQKSISYREVGTTFSATPRIGGDNAVAVDVQLQESRIHTPEGGVQIAAGTTASEFIQTMFNGKVSVTSGEAVLAQGVKTDNPTTKTQSLVIVAAKILDK